MDRSLLDQIDAFVAQWPDAAFGPAHIVLSDYNLDDHCLGYCTALCDYAATLFPDHPPAEIAATRAVLEELYQIDPSVRQAVEETYAAGRVAVDVWSTTPTATPLADLAVVKRLVTSRSVPFPE